MPSFWKVHIIQKNPDVLKVSWNLKKSLDGKLKSLDEQLNVVLNIMVLHHGWVFFTGLVFFALFFPLFPLSGQRLSQSRATPTYHPTHCGDPFAKRLAVRALYGIHSEIWTIHCQWVLKTLKMSLIWIPFKNIDWNVVFFEDFLFWKPIFSPTSHVVHPGS